VQQLNPTIAAKMFFNDLPIAEVKKYYDGEFKRAKSVMF
jgi:hypothetical protein